MAIKSKARRSSVRSAAILSRKLRLPGTPGVSSNFNGAPYGFGNTAGWNGRQPAGVSRPSGFGVLPRILPLLLAAASVCISFFNIFNTLSAVGTEYFLDFFTWRQVLSYALSLALPLIFFLLSKRREAFPAFSLAAWIVLIFEIVMCVLYSVFYYQLLTGSATMPAALQQIISFVPGAGLGAAFCSFCMLQVYFCSRYAVQLPDLGLYDPDLYFSATLMAKKYLGVRRRTGKILFDNFILLCYSSIRKQTKTSKVLVCFFFLPENLPREYTHTFSIRIHGRVFKIFSEMEERTCV